MRRRRASLFATLPAVSFLAGAPALAGCGLSLRQSGTGAGPEPEAPRIDVRAAYEAVSAGRAILVDVRGELSFRAKRGAGALLLPLDDVERAPAEAARRLPAGKQPILYCT